jgi:transposase
MSKPKPTLTLLRSSAVDLRKHWIGIDIGEQSSGVCVIGGAGEIVRESICPTSLPEILNGIGDVVPETVAKIGVEAGCGTHIVRKLRHLGWPVAVLETRKVKRLLELRRNKSDVNDARGLADVVRLAGNSRIQVHLKGLDCQHIRTRLRLRQQLIQQRVAVEGLIRSLFQLHGGHLKSLNKNTPLRVRAEAEIQRIRLAEEIDLEEEIEPLVTLAEGLRACLRKTDAWVLKAVGEHPVCGRFMAIPGVGPICALSFYSAVEEPSRFRRTSDVGAYFGLTPRLHQTGNSERMLGITRMGNGLTRSHLVIAAMSLLRSRKATAGVQDWGLAIAKRRGVGRARVAVARKLSMIMLSMWRGGADFDATRKRNGSGGE